MEKEKNIILKMNYFEGEYLNGKKNGKGKFIIKDKFIIEAEFFEDRMIKSKTYDKNGNLLNEEKDSNEKIIKTYTLIFHPEAKIFEGEFLNGKRNGKGKEFFLHNGNLKFEGEYINDKKNGKGKEYDLNGELMFEGEYLNGKKWNGLGYDKYNKPIYELKNGNGIMKEFLNYDEEINEGINFRELLGFNFYFEGEYKNGERNGKGKEYNKYNELIFEGEYLNGIKNGKGKDYNFLGKLIFEGEYLDGKRNGKGKEYCNGNLIFEGEYLYNYKIKGKEYINNILIYEGEYLFNKKFNGKGYDENGNLIFELINGNGKIKEYNDNGTLKFEGEYLNGKRNGKGKEYDHKGKLEFEGEYLNGKKYGKGKEYDEKVN